MPHLAIGDTRMIVNIAVILVLIPLLRLAIRPSNTQNPRHYAPRPPLSKTEAEFYQRLRAALPTKITLAQVSMSALIDVKLTTAYKTFLQRRGPIAQKYLDFLICDGADVQNVLAVVEHDDHTDDAKKDAERDRLLNSLGYRVFRWDVRRKTDRRRNRCSIRPRQLSHPVLANKRKREADTTAVTV